MAFPGLPSFLSPWLLNSTCGLHVAQEVSLQSHSVSHLVLALGPRADYFTLTCNGAQGPTHSPAQDASFLSLDLPFGQTSFAPTAPSPASVAGTLSLADAQPSLHLTLVLEG